VHPKELVVKVEEGQVQVTLNVEWVISACRRNASFGLSGG
jgi:hypothetical protein